MLIDAVTLVVGLLPGLILGLALPAGRERWMTWAASPVLTLGLTSVGMAWLPTVGLPDSVGWVLGAELAVAVVVVVLARVVARRRAVSRPQGDPAESARIQVGDVIGFAVPAAVVAGFGQLLLGRLAYPPGWDAMNHGILMGNILQSGSTQTTSVCVTGSSVPRVSCHFYPLAMDVSWAQVAALAGARPSAAMLAWTMLIGPLAMIAALYATIRVLGGTPMIASCVALAVSVIGPMWSSLDRGRPNETFGSALGIGIVSLAVVAWRGRRPVPMGLLAGLGSAGLLITHSYDVLFVAVLAVACVLTQRCRPVIRSAGVATVAMAVATVLSIAPLIGALAGAGSERSSNEPSFSGNLHAALRYWVLTPAHYAPFGFMGRTHVPFGQAPLAVQISVLVVFGALVASPLSLVYAELRWARGWLIAAVLWTLIGIWTSVSGSSAARLLAGTWYEIVSRLLVMILPVYAVLAVAGAAAIGISVRRLSGPRRAGPAPARPGVPVRPGRRRIAWTPTSVGAATLAVLAIVLALVPSSIEPTRADLATFSPVGPSYPAVYHWLADHTPPGHVVAWDLNRDFMTWAFPDQGVPVLFGITAVDPSSIQNFHQRHEAFDWLVDDPGATRAGCLVRKFRISYLATGSRHVPGFPGRDQASRAAASTRLRLVHRDGPLRVYKVTRAALRCHTVAARSTSAG